MKKENHRRLWIVCFGPGDDCGWIVRNVLTRPWQHVVACAWYPEHERWVYFNPGRHGTAVQLYTDKDFGRRFELVLNNATRVVEIASAFERNYVPPFFSCLGAIKALLGLRSWAPTPYLFYRELLRRGALELEVKHAEVSSDPAGVPS